MSSLAVKVVYVSAMLASSLVSSLTPLAYFTGAVKDHPSQLIVAICLVQLVKNYNLLLISLNIYDFQKAVNLQKLLRAWSFGLLDFKDEDSLVFCEINLQIYFFLETINIVYNLLLTIDMLITLTRPFLSGKYRNKYYHASALLLSLLLASTLNYQQATICNTQAADPQPRLLIPQDFIVLQLVFITIGVGSCIFGLYHLWGQIIQYKRKYLERHLLMVFSLVVVWCLPIINIEFIDSHKQLYHIINDISFSLLLSSSLFINLIRLSEPFFRRTILNLLLFRKRETQNNQLDAWNTTIAKLASQQNNKLVIQQLLIVIQQIVSSGQNIEHFSKHFNQGKFIVNATVHKGNQFLRMREEQGLTADTILQSFKVQLNKSKLKEARQSLGASGNFFFFTYDNRFVLKTIELQQVETLKTLVEKNLFGNMRMANRFIGCFSFQLNKETLVHCCILENTMQKLLDKLQPNNLRIYDLKGSLINREEGKNALVKKDVDFLKSEDLFVAATKEQISRLFQIIDSQTQFLSQNNIMDYSLLLVVADNYEGSFDYRMLRCKLTGKVYSFAIIDCLQTFSTNKWMQYRWKSLFTKHKEQLSCIQPVLYRKRFNQMIRSIICVVK